MALSIRRRTTYCTPLRHRALTIRLPRSRLIHTTFQHPKPYPTPTRSLPRLYAVTHHTISPGVSRPWVRMYDHRERSTTIGRFLLRCLVPQGSYSSYHPTVLLPMGARAVRSQGYTRALAKGILPAWIYLSQIRPHYPSFS